ncbi:GJ15723 (plasmid) [Bradyrhizobium diazoefficiens]|uniref:GJ15723 n=1 Tax=Bradyrhizobium diazoefficiens TaxID=1355477 RepID=A0A0E3VXT0_9BRAD|nr:GJ15723 [Bradyrhizobium diazoefficiens]
MVYDRDRKGAANLKDYSLAEKLTKEQAEQIKQRWRRLDRRLQRLPVLAQRPDGRARWPDEMRLSGLQPRLLAQSEASAAQSFVRSMSRQGWARALTGLPCPSLADMAHMLVRAI